MDNNSPLLVVERSPSSTVNGSARRMQSPTGTTRPVSLVDAHIVQLVVQRDEKGYGMKVSGDNPVYVQSVKEGGPAEKAGLHAGDKILKVNGITVVTFTHTDVVDLIKSSSQVVLTVQQRTSRASMGSPSGTHGRPLTAHTSTTITNPQPVDNVKQRQLLAEKEQHYRLMIEKEQRYIDVLRSQLATTPDEKKFVELTKTEKNLHTLQAMLQRNHSEPPGNPTHQRTKSSPDTLLNLGPSSDSSARLINSESMNDISRQEAWDRPEAPPGTPPPPYPSPRMDRKTAPDDSDGKHFGEVGSHDFSIGNRVLVDNSPIHAATPPVAQQPIISMEDDEISDQEMEPEEHSPFKSLTRLWENPPHLAVFTNYVLSNADPNSLLFYLLTDLYKEGNCKEMKKWAFEIHSTFLVPGAPLRLGNVDENVAREIDDVLLREYDKEEILRKIFWKARARAKEELGRQLVDFQQKRTAGLGTLYGPVDSALAECYHDKSKELKHYESLFTEKLEPYLTELEKENYDPKKFYMAAALITVMQRIFGLRLAASQLERCPLFVNKEKSLKNKLLPGRYSRKLNIQGHQFIAQQYYNVILCNNCHQIIYGIGPQGYRCNDCNINLHRQCVKLYDDSCPGPVNKKDRGLGKILRIRPHESDHRRKASATNNFLHMERDRRQAEEKEAENNDNGESKPSQPVSRSGSDRRPDSVREEGGGGGKHHDSPAGGSPDSAQDKNDDSPVDSSVSLPSSGNKKRNTSNINRSESVKEQSEKQRKQRRNISDPSQNTSSHHDIEHTGLSNTTDSGSSSNSNSSISFNGRLSESPSNPNDSLRGNRSDGDSDMDADSDHINWQDLISTEQLNNLPPHEKKRQDVINELFCTEKSHMRSLNVLHKIFYKPLQKSQVLKPDELSLIFPNIKELLQVHRQFNHEMTQKRREDPIVRNLGDLLLNMLSGNTGEAFKEAAAKFCERQQLALELIKERRKRDSKFDSILAEGEKKRQCRRLQFQAILPVEMQRLSKLPLLLERLIGAVQEGNGNEEELNKLNKAFQLSKEIANYVNEAARLALNQARLEDIQRHLDQSNFERSNDPISQEFRPLDLTKYKLVREGPMHLRRPNKSSVLVHVLLMEEVVVILHKEGDRYLLKNFQSGTSGQTNPLSPIIKISTLLVRINAVCKNALFLVNTSTMNSQMYDLRAEDDAKRDVWFKHFSDVTDAHNKKEGKTRRPEPTPDNEDEESVQEFPQPQDVSERAEEVDHVENDDSFRTPPVSDASGGTETENEVPSEEKDNCDEAATVEGGGNAGVPTRVTAEEWPLIQPSQVHVAVLPIHTAESRLTPIEQIRRKDEEVRRALKDKENLIADLLSIPQQDFHTIADMVSEEESTSDPINLTMASIYQTNRLQKIINDTLNLSDESDVIQATGGRSTSCTSQITPRSNQPPSIPVSQVQDIVNRLSKHLTELLDKQKQLEDEKSLLRNELYKMREKVHEQLSIHDSSGSSSVLPDNSTLQNDEEVEMESETNGGS